jgi:hypothetical protein
MHVADIDLETLAMALADQSTYDHRWFINPATGEIFALTDDDDIDAEAESFTEIDPLPSSFWYRDMADFTALVSDPAATRRLQRAIQGKGAFRRFRTELHEEYPELLSAWTAFSDVRARRRAVDWLVETGLVDERDAQLFRNAHPDPVVP